MIITPNRFKRHLFLAACLFFKGLIVSSTVMASNEILKVSAVEDQGGARIMVFFMERPSYSLRAVSEAHILLTFNDTLRGQAFEKDIPEGNMFSLSEGGNPVVLKFDINLQRTFSRIESTWFEDRKLLYIDITSMEDPAAVIKPSQNKTTLQDIRFGLIEKGTRMVMKVDNNPSWEMVFETPSLLKMRFFDVSNALKKEKFGPVKRLKEVNVLKTKDKVTDLSLALESSLNRVSIFRMTAEDRLVLDIMDNPGEIPGEEAASNDKTSAAAGLKEDKLQAKTVIEDKGNYLRIKIGKNETPVDAPVTENSPAGDIKPETAIIPAVNPEPETANVPAGEAKPETENIMTGETKTGANDAPAGEIVPETGKPEVIEIDSPVKIEPKLDDALPMSLEMKQAMDKLSPEEAFLYGRIKQAMEIKDYEKGIALTNQFLNELPDSPLAEDMLFLKGDLYYSLWKNGDNEVADNIISSFQKAIDRFPESKNVPSGYIKMAQAQQSITGGEYMALGYLGLVMTRKDISELMPLAYLTRGKIFLRLNQPEKAIADFNVIMEQYKGSEYAPEAAFWTANYHHAVGEYDEAEKKLEEVLGMDPAIFIEYPEYLFLRAKNYLYLNDYDHAREYLFKAVNIGRQQEGADMLLARIGDTYHNQENEKEAEKYYRMVIDYYPGTEGALISRLRIADYSSDISALDELSTGEGNESISELAILQKGYKLYDKDQYASVVDTVKQLIDKPVQTETSKNARSLFFNAAEKEMARLYEGGDFKGMTDFYISIQGPLTGNIKTETMLNVALAFKRLNLNEQAIQTFKGIKLNELNVQSRGAYYTGFAQSYLDNRDIAEARALLEKARNYSLQPAEMQRVSRTLALLYIEDNKLNDAYALCQSIIDGEKLLPEDELAEVYILAGRIFNLQKRYAETVRTITSMPGMPDRIKGDLLKPAYLELGKAYYNMGNYQKAAGYYEKVFDLGYSTDNSDYWNLRFNLAQSYMNAGENNKARELLSEISEGGDTISQQRAQLQLGTMELETQLQRLPLGRN